MAKFTAARKKIPAGQFAGPNRSTPYNNPQYPNNRSNPQPDNERAEAAQGVKDNEQAETKKAKANKMLFGGK